MGSGKVGREEGNDGVTNDRVAPLGIESEGSRGEQRVTPKREADDQQGENEEEPKSRVGCERVRRGEGMKGRPATVETQELTVNRGVADPAVMNMDRQTRKMKSAREKY